VLHCVGGEWSVLVISLLGDGSGSAAELARSIEGASERVLAPALRALERDGLVCRTASPGGEARAIYELTPLGKSVLDPAVALATWAELHRFDVGDARARHDGRGRTGPGR
jgi:DNA-binding HxlR family transcriptional regulator